MNLLTDYYKTILLSIKRGRKNGSLSNAKPLFFLAIVDSIEKGLIIGNKFGYEEFLEHQYYSFCEEIEPDIKATLFFKPFYHMDADSFYHIKWKVGPKADHKWHTPSAKYLQTNIDYAYFDPELWDLLQDPSSREELKNAVVKHFFPNYQH